MDGGGDVGGIGALISFWLEEFEDVSSSSDNGSNKSSSICSPACQVGAGALLVGIGGGREVGMAGGSLIQYIYIFIFL